MYNVSRIAKPCYIQSYGLIAKYDYMASVVRFVAQASPLQTGLVAYSPLQTLSVRHRFYRRSILQLKAANLP